MKPTLKELRAKMDLRQAERERRALCKEFDICPECGAELKWEQVEVLDPPVKWFCGIFVTKTRKWDHRKVCPIDRSHYEDKYDFDPIIPY